MMNVQEKKKKVEVGVEKSRNRKTAASSPIYARHVHALELGQAEK